MSRRGLAYHNDPPTHEEPLPEHAPPEYVKAEFARRLSALIQSKGWNQSELARQASKHLSNGRAMNRDNVSNYVAGKHIPGPIFLKAICKALRVEPEDLLPVRDVPRAGDTTPPLDARDMGDGTVFLRINQRVDWKMAIRVMSLLKGED